MRGGPAFVILTQLVCFTTATKVVSPQFEAASFGLFAIALVLGACNPSRTEKVAGVDDFGDSVRVGRAPTRIVSMGPVTTEILFALGAGARVVGRSDFDLFPDSAKLVPSLGLSIPPNVEAVLGLKPDLVVLYASGSNRSAARRFRAAGVNTLSLKTDRISDFRRAVTMLGAITGDSAKAKIIIDSVDKTLELVRSATSGLPKPTVFWHIWDAPLITIGAGSFMNELVEIAGARNVYADIPGPSETISFEDVARRNPDFILAGPIGAAAIARDPRWKIIAASREKRVLIVDTVLVALPSIRLGEAAVSLANLLHAGALR